MLDRAARLVTIPDLMHYWLTGRIVCEYTNATTTQCVDARPGAERVDIRLAANQVIVTRRFSELPEPSVWTLPLDGSAPARPARGSAVVTNGRLVITHERAWEIVTHVYNVEGDTLRVERSIRPKSADGNAQL